jgi:hypothetical protein
MNIEDHRVGRRRTFDWIRKRGFDFDTYGGPVEAEEDLVPIYETVYIYKDREARQREFQTPWVPLA